MTSLYEDIKFKLYILKLELGLKLTNNKRKFARKHLCRTGYHKLRVGSVRWGNPKKMTSVRFLRCEHCEYIFFTSEREKTKYTKKKKEENAKTNAFFESIMLLPKEHRKEYQKDMAKGT